jgi:serine/threonine-protein kinase RsbW
LESKKAEASVMAHVKGQGQIRRLLMFPTSDEFDRISQEKCRDSGWRQEGVRSTAEIGRVLDGLVEILEARGYARKDVFGIRLAVEETLVNAVKHGHRGDPTKRVSVRYCVGTEYTLIEVEDQGAGFDPDSVPDPVAPENWERPCGRGLVLIRSYATWVRFSRGGSRVTLCKARS